MIPGCIIIQTLYRDYTDIRQRLEDIKTDIKTYIKTDIMRYRYKDRHKDTGTKDTPHPA